MRPVKKKARISSFAHYCWRWLHSRYFIEWLRHIFIAPFGRLRKPADVEWEKSYNGKYYPVCPHCKNIPYDEGSCYFCGQRFSNLLTSIYVPIESDTFTTTFSDSADFQKAAIERTVEGTVRSTAAMLAKIAFDAGVSSAQIEESSDGLYGGEDDMTVGKRIQFLRKRCGYTQKELAEKSGVPVVTLQQYEREVRKQPKTEQLEKIASALGTSAAYLLGYFSQPEERHGSWIRETDFESMFDVPWMCSECHGKILLSGLYTPIGNGYIYCPMCGARMNAKETDYDGREDE